MRTGIKKRLHNRSLLAGILIVVGIAAIGNPVHFIGSLQSNFTALELISSLTEQSSNMQELTNMINDGIMDDCQKEWLTGLFANQIGDAGSRNQYWKMTLDCSGDYLEGIFNLAKEDQSLAEFAVMTRPDKEQSWLWLASIIVQADPESAIPLYKKALEIKTNNGLTWYRLGEAYELAGKKTDAIDAFVTSCDFLNRGSDCYVRAGKIMESSGDIPSAIYYYRLSISEGANLRADFLESQFGDN